MDRLIQAPGFYKTPIHYVEVCFRRHVARAFLAGTCMLLVLSGKVNSQKLDPDDGSKVRISPAAVQSIGGKLPTSTLVDIGLKDCSSGDLSKDGVIVFGQGLSLDKLKAGACDISGTLTIDPATPSGAYAVIVVDGTGAPIGHYRASISILDPGAGAIPPGLAPQVDVMWDVLSQQVCSDVFGRRVAKYFYCIEVKVGNNSGHPLQLAGIGFSQRIESLESEQLGILANSSYASTRAVLLREEVLSPRNIFFHSVEATGLLMAGFTPYFHAANAAAHYSTAVGIVAGPLLQAINIVGPDRVVTQLNNLDDQSFRDSQIVPNNTQIRTTVFMEKRALTERLAALPAGEPKAEGEKLALADFKVKTDSNGKSVAKYSNIQAEQIAESVDNSQQKGHPNLTHLGAGGDFSPFAVKRALGNLVVVGDQIEFLQRIQIQSASSGGASTLSITPSKIDFGNIQSGLPTGAKTVTVINNGGSALSGVSAAISGTNKDEFSQTTTCGSTIAAGASCTIKVTANLNADGVAAATLGVSSSGGSTQNVSLEANGYGLGLSWKPNSLEFAALKVGVASKTPEGVITLTNGLATPISGGLTFAVSGTNATDFVQSSNCSAAAPLAAKATCNITVTFTPSATGPRAATLQVNYSVGGTKLTSTFALSGTGQ